MNMINGEDYQLASLSMDDDLDEQEREALERTKFPDIVNPMKIQEQSVGAET